MMEAPGVVIACGRCSLWSVKRFLVVKTNPLFRYMCHLLHGITAVVSVWDSDGITTSTGPTASVTIAAGTVEAAVVDMAVEVSGGSNGGRENLGRHIQLNHRLCVKAICAMV